MKNLSLTLSSFVIFLVTTSGSAAAQGVQTSTYVEQTKVSPKLGTTVGYQFSDEIEVGAFFQRATELHKPEAGRPLTAENEFYGAYFAYPVFSRKLANVKFNVRTGVSNGENFVITPSLLANFKPFKNIHIGGGIGTRAFRPTYMAALKININGGNTRGGFLALND